MRQYFDLILVPFKIYISTGNFELSMPPDFVAKFLYIFSLTIVYYNVAVSYI